jgi:hypothetical protein
MIDLQKLKQERETSRARNHAIWRLNQIVDLLTSIFGAVFMALMKHCVF